jgi:hypothetical protein
VDNLPARHYAASLLGMYNKMMVITLPADKSTQFIAGETLPFDYTQLSDLLGTNGQTQFIIYDTPAVQTIVREVHAGT